MRKILLYFCLSLFPSFMLGQTAEGYFVTYIDSLSEKALIHDNSNIVSVKVVTGTRSVKSRQGNLIANINDDYYITTDVEHCIQVALNLWEDRLVIKRPVYIQFESDDTMEPELGLKTKVAYLLDGQTAVPSALYTQLHDINDTLLSVISINANIDWNSSWANEIKLGKNNLITAIMRQLAHVFGFGTSLVMRDGGVGFSIGNRFASAYDRLVFDNNNNCLGNLVRKPSSQIIDFAKRNIYIKLPTVKLKLYTDPNMYVPYKSLNYFALEGDNLMNYPCKDVTKAQAVNKEVLDVLQAIGWDIYPHDNIELRGIGVDPVGYISAYSSYTFNGYNDNRMIANGNLLWQYQLYNNSEKCYEEMTSVVGTSFTIDPITPNSNYVDEFGCLQGKISLRFFMDGFVHKYTRPLFLDIKPLFIEYSMFNKVDEGDYYSIDFRIKTKGLDKGTVAVCNPYAMSIEYKFDGSDDVLIKLPHIFKFGTTRLDLYLENEMGITLKRIYVNYDDLGKMVKKAGNHESYKYFVYTIQGIEILHSNDATRLNSLPKGRYIVRELVNGQWNSKIVSK